MLSSLSNTQKGILFSAAGFSAFVISDSLAKWLAKDYAVLMVIGWSYTFAVIFGVLMSPFMGGMKATLSSKKMPIHIGRGVCNLSLAIAIVYAFQNLPLTTVYPVLFLAPFVITILAIPIYKEKVQPRNWIIIALGFSGVVVAYRPGVEEMSIWILVAFIGMFFIAFQSLLARALGKDETLLSLSFYPSCFNAILLLPSVFIYAPFPEIADLPYFIGMGIMLILGMSGVGHACRIAPYSVVAPLHYSQLVLAFIIGYLVFNETPDIWKISGALIIAISGLMLVMSEKKKIEVV